MATQSRETVLSPEVVSVLRSKSAEEEFRVTEKVARESFPEMLAMEVRLQDDPDEEGITRVIVEVVLPESMPSEKLSECRKAYYEELDRQLPRIEWPVCGLTINFA